MKPSEKRTTKLKELIERAELTQRQLSDITNVSEKSVNEWARGASFPRLDRAVLLARALGVSLKELCEALGIPVEGVPGDKDKNADSAGNTIGIDE